MGRAWGQAVTSNVLLSSPSSSPLPLSSPFLPHLSLPSPLFLVLLALFSCCSGYTGCVGGGRSCILVCHYCTETLVAVLYLLYKCSCLAQAHAMTSYCLLDAQNIASCRGHKTGQHKDKLRKFCLWFMQDLLSTYCPKLNSDLRFMIHVFT